MTSHWASKANDICAGVQSRAAKLALQKKQEKVKSWQLQLGSIQQSKYFHLVEMAEIALI
jgi:hypothetical protein